MAHFDGPPYEERFSGDSKPQQETYLDGLVAAADVINDIYSERGLQNMIDLELPAGEYTDETLQREIEKLYRSAGELAIGAEIKARLEILIREALLKK